MLKHSLNFIFVLLFSVNLLNAQPPSPELAQVDSLFKIPVFLHAEPNLAYTEVGRVKAPMRALDVSLNNDINLHNLNQELVWRAKQGMKFGKYEAFDAVILQPDSFEGILIRYQDETEQLAVVNQVSDASIYIYAQPQAEYEVIGSMWTMIGEVSAQVSFEERLHKIVNRAEKKVAEGKLEAFDAIVFDPVRLKCEFIKYTGQES
ncbi:MAG: hypothetical protein AAGM67_03330 [Bacteroidota bacterium]